MSTLQSPASRHLWKSHLRISCHGGLFLTKQLQISLGGRWHWAEETRSPRTVDLGDPGVAAVGSSKAAAEQASHFILCVTGMPGYLGGKSQRSISLSFLLPLSYRFLIHTSALPMLSDIHPSPLHLFQLIHPFLPGSSLTH